MGTDGFEVTEYTAEDAVAPGRLFEAIERDRFERGTL